MLGQHRSTQRHIACGRDDEDRLVADIIELARCYGRYCYRRIAALPRDAGWQVNDKRVERLWRREGLKMSGKQPKRGRVWLNDGSLAAGGARNGRGLFYLATRRPAEASGPAESPRGEG